MREVMEDGAVGVVAEGGGRSAAEAAGVTGEGLGGGVVSAAIVLIIEVRGNHR